MELAFVADDLGYSTIRDDGIFNTVLRYCRYDAEHHARARLNFVLSVLLDNGSRDNTCSGCVRSVCLIVNGVSAAEAATRACQQRIDVGLHLNFTEGRPICPVAEITSLVNEDGFFLGKFGFWDAFLENRVDIQHVAKEAEAQLQRFVDLCGINPTFFNGHNHVHILPSVAECLALLFGARGIRCTRLPIGAW